MDTFVPIPNFDGYFINKNGEILSKRMYKEGRIMKLKINKGYYRIGLHKDKKKKQMFIHRLLALTFIPNDNNLSFVDHIDRNRTNNKLENLRWVSRELNNQNATRHKDNKLGHKNIYLWIDKKNGHERYKVQIIRNGKKHEKKCKTLECAISYRDEYITALGEEIIN